MYQVKLWVDKTLPSMYYQKPVLFGIYNELQYSKLKVAIDIMQKVHSLVAKGLDHLLIPICSGRKCAYISSYPCT